MLHSIICMKKGDKIFKRVYAYIWGSICLHLSFGRQYWVRVSRDVLECNCVVVYCFEYTLPMGSGTIWRCGFVGVGVASLE